MKSMVSIKSDYDSSNHAAQHESPQQSSDRVLRTATRQITFSDTDAALNVENDTPRRAAADKLLSSNPPVTRAATWPVNVMAQEIPAAVEPSGEVKRNDVSALDTVLSSNQPETLDTVLSSSQPETLDTVLSSNQPETLDAVLSSNQPETLDTVLSSNQLETLAAPWPTNGVTREFTVGVGSSNEVKWSDSSALDAELTADEKLSLETKSGAEATVDETRVEAGIAFGAPQQAAPAKSIGDGSARKGEDALKSDLRIAGVGSTNADRSDQGRSDETFHPRVDTRSSEITRSASTGSQSETKAMASNVPKAVSAVAVGEAGRSPLADVASSETETAPLLNDVRSSARSEPQVLAPAAALTRPITTDGGDVIQQAVQVALSKTSGAKLELRLDPPELGRVEIEFDFSDDKLTVVVRTEKEEALDLMRRNAAELIRSFKSAGLDLGSLGFSRDGTSDEPSAERGQFAVAGGEDPSNKSTHIAQSLSIDGSGRLDIRI